MTRWPSGQQLLKMGAMAAEGAPGGGSFLKVRRCGVRRIRLRRCDAILTSSLHLIYAAKKRPQGTAVDCVVVRGAVCPVVLLAGGSVFPDFLAKEGFGVLEMGRPKSQCE